VEIRCPADGRHTDAAPAAARRGFQNALVRVEAPELRREFLWLIGLASLVALLWNVYTAS
jgi:hypothetical protein